MILSAVFYFSPAFLIIGLIGLAVTIYCIVDIARRPDWAWQAAGQNKVLWLVLTIVGHFLCWVIFDVIYLAAIRPKVVAAGSGGAPPMGGGYGTPYGGGYPSPGGGYGSPPGYGPPPSGYGTPSGYGGPTGGYPTPPPPPASPNSPPPGWYPDPAGSGQPRYWNGQSWMEEGPR